MALSGALLAILHMTSRPIVGEIIEPPTEEPPTEEPTEPPTEAGTEEPTEPITEPPTEEGTEEVTEPPTEEGTEFVTEPPTEFVTEEPTEQRPAFMLNLYSMTPEPANNSNRPRGRYRGVVGGGWFVGSSLYQGWSNNYSGFEIEPNSGFAQVVGNRLVWGVQANQRDSTSTRRPLFRLLDAANNITLSVFMNYSGNQLIVELLGAAISGSPFAYTFPALSTPVWMTGEIVFDNSAGTLKISIDGTEIVNASGLDTIHSSGNKPSAVAMTCQNTSGSVPQWSRLILTDGDGPAELQYPLSSDLHIATLMPTSDVSGGWTPNTGVDDFAVVDEAQADTGTFIDTTTTNLESRMGLPSFAEAGFAIAVQPFVIGFEQTSNESVDFHMFAMGEDFTATLLMSNTSTTMESWALPAEYVFGFAPPDLNDIELSVVSRPTGIAPRITSMGLDVLWSAATESAGILASEEAQDNSNASTGITISNPGGFAAGKRIVISIASNGGLGTITWPTGFVQEEGLGSLVSGGSVYITTASKIAEAGDVAATDFTVSHTTARAKTAHFIALDGFLLNSDSGTDPTVGTDTDHTFTGFSAPHATAGVLISAAGRPGSGNAFSAISDTTVEETPAGTNAPGMVTAFDGASALGDNLSVDATYTTADRLPYSALLFG